jgi:hypothetical protein
MFMLPFMGWIALAGPLLSGYKDSTMHARGLGKSVCRPQAMGGLLAAALLLVYLIAIAPHLVRHTFDEHHGHHGKPACPLYTQSQLSTAECHLVPAEIGSPPLAGLLPDQKLAAHPLAPARYAIQPRAPPHFLTFA